jgi:hypothetical protein
MARRTSTAEADSSVPAKNEKPPRSLAVAEHGIKTGNDFANMMSALMSDLIEGRVTPSVGNATCNAGGKLLKVVELQYKYGTRGKGTGEKTLVLALEDSCERVGE